MWIFTKLLPRFSRLHTTSILKILPLAFYIMQISTPASVCYSTYSPNQEYRPNFPEEELKTETSHNYIVTILAYITSKASCVLNNSNHLVTITPVKVCWSNF